MVAGEEFIDIGGIVQADPALRARTDGLAIHHSVGQTHFTDKNFNGTTEDEEVAHIIAIRDYTAAKWGVGFAYNGCVFASGRVYVVRHGLGIRAHVAFQNHRLEGLCMIGTYNTQRPSDALIAGAGRWVKAKHSIYGEIPVKPHRDWVAPEHKPQWSTACCGDAGVAAIPDILRAAKEDDMAITMVACGDSPTGYRLYALGEGPPRWITDPKAANDLIALFGAPKGLSWAALKGLGAT